MKTLMKILICILMFFCLYCQGQDTIPIKKYRHEIGIDATYILKSTLITANYYNPYFSSDTSVSVLNLYKFNVNCNPYILIYNFFFTNNIGIRFGYGQYITNSTTDNNLQNISGLNNSTNTIKNLTNKTTNIYSRLGLQFNKALTKKWESYFGIDFINSYKDIYSKISVDYPNANNNSYNNYNSDYESSSRTKSLSYGSGPFIGIKFKINDRILLSTETSIYFIYSNSTSDYDYIGTTNTQYYTTNTQYNISTHNISQTHLKGFQINLNAPMVIFLAIKL